MKYQISIWDVEFYFVHRVSNREVLIWNLKGWKFLKWFDVWYCFLNIIGKSKYYMYSIVFLHRKEIMINHLPRLLKLWLMKEHPYLLTWAIQNQLQSVHIRNLKISIPIRKLPDTSWKENHHILPLIRNCHYTYQYLRSFSSHDAYLLKLHDDSGNSDNS